MKRKNKYAFTLVELIVVITILAILWTIAFISLQWYSASSRDSVRISDVSNMKTSLELFHLNAWKYPLPDDNEIIDYGSETLWYQWEFWTNVVSQLSRNLNEIPTDPLTDKKYIYSVAWNKNEFEILNLLEWDIAYNPHLSSPKGRGIISILNQTNAATLTVTPRIDGTYNWVFIKTANYIVPVPSIITAEDITWWLTLTTDNIKSQIINWWENIPNLWNINYNTWALINLTLNATWTIDKDSTDAQKLSVYQAIYDTYSWTTLANDWVIQIILNKTTDEEKIAITKTVVLNNTTTVATVTSNSCDDSTKPADDLNKTYTVNPTSINQAYVQDSSECWYTCDWWYTWTNCEIEPPLITSTDCTNAWWMWVDSANDVYIWTTQWSWFCISPRFWDWQTNWTDLNDWAWWISWNGWWNEILDYYNWWDSSSIDDTWNPYPNYWQTKKIDSEVSYNCKAIWTASSDFDITDTVAWRMKWLATTWNTYANARSIDWITWLVPHTVWTYPQAIPALYIADCIDWVKDLWITMTYTHNEDTTSDITYAQYNTDNTENTDTAFLSDTTYQDRQKYLTAWTQRAGSHLPSAMSHITTWYASATDADGDFLTTTSRWEYQVACEASLLTDANDDTDNERIWLSAIGRTTGTYRGRRARIVGGTGCGDQSYSSTGNRTGNLSARFVVRP